MVLGLAKSPECCKHVIKHICDDSGEADGAGSAGLVPGPAPSRTGKEAPAKLGQWGRGSEGRRISGEGPTNILDWALRQNGTTSNPIQCTCKTKHRCNAAASIMRHNIPAKLRGEENICITFDRMQKYQQKGGRHIKCLSAVTPTFSKMGCLPLLCPHEVWLWNACGWSKCI